MVVVVEIFITQRQAEYALRDQIVQRVLDELGVAVVLEAGGEAAHDGRFLFQFLQQQGAAIGGDVASVEFPNQFPAAQVLGRSQRLNEGVEALRSFQWRDDESHAGEDARGAAEVTTSCKNV